jgi:hypothetical protein
MMVIFSQTRHHLVSADAGLPHQWAGLATLDGIVGLPFKTAV